ncbi:MAG: AAA family ATPase, partial [Balneolaceae bacterium]|nr:AAA family ATPase [Balneolaceae bacterium]
KIFKKLGSSDFSIHKKISRRGDLPTVQIIAKFSGVEITNDKLKSFFSESDRRALALSIFWAKIELLETDQRKNTIVILDDPVTSFDDGRIEQSIRLMNREKYGLNQLIIISHYPRYLKSFFDRTNADQNGISLLQIEKDHEGSKLVDAKSAEFVDTPHQKMFKRIVDFVERKHSKSIEKDLRVYLENEVRLRYQKQILDNSLSNKQFGELIDELNKIGAIKDEISYELHEFRKSLNADHHVIRDRPDEDIRSFGNEVLEFIYSKL